MLQIAIIQVYTKVNKKINYLLAIQLFFQGTDKDSVLCKYCFLGK